MKKLSLLLVTMLLLLSCDGGGSGGTGQGYSDYNYEERNILADVEASSDYPIPETLEDEQEEDYYDQSDSQEPVYSVSYSYSYGYVGSKEEEMSEEDRYFAKFSNFNRSYSDREGEVVYEGRGDYYVIETSSGYVIAERRSGPLYEGNRIYGQLHSTGYNYFINKSFDSEIALDIEDYYLSESRVIDWLGEHDKLKYSDQSQYDEENDY